MDIISRTKSGDNIPTVNQLGTIVISFINLKNQEGLSQS